MDKYIAIPIHKNGKPTLEFEWEEGKELRGYSVVAVGIMGRVTFYESSIDSAQKLLVTSEGFTYFVKKKE
jgi:hypothetical protein